MQNSSWDIVAFLKLNTIYRITIPRGKHDRSNHGIGIRGRPEPQRDL